MIDQYPSPNGVLTSLIWRKTAIGGETSLLGYDNASQALSYTPGQEQVYLNGILLVRGSDYTATNGTSITNLVALTADDFIQVNCYNNFSVASVPANSITGSISNAQLQNSAITINGSAISLGGSTTIAGYLAPTIGSTSIASGATVTTIAGLTLTSPTLTGTVTASGDINLSAANGPGSVIDELTLLLMGAL